MRRLNSRQALCVTMREENLQQLRGYVERHGRPAAVHTDKACLFQVTPRAMALPLYFQSLGS